MRRAVNSTEVARLAGVSRTTVSFVLNGRDDSERIPLATRDRVLQAAEDLGYKPNHMARVLLSGRSYLINLLVRHVNPTFFSRAIEAFNATLVDTGYDLRIQETAVWTPERWKEAANDRWPVDGMIVIEEPAFIANLVEATQGRIPIVNVGSAISTAVDHVSIDLETGVAQAVRHLIDSGRTRVAMIGPAYLRRMSRWSAYEAEISRLGAESSVIVADPDLKLTERAQARHAMTAFLEGGGQPDGLVCFNDEYAIGALRALKEQGLRVPQDVAIVGCDDIEDTEYHDPPLSTLRYPYDEAARLAWEMLRRRIDNPELPRQSKVLAAELIVRQSSLSAADDGS